METRVDLASEKFADVGEARAAEWVLDLWVQVSETFLDCLGAALSKVGR